MCWTSCSLEAACATTGTATVPSATSAVTSIRRSIAPPSVECANSGTMAPPGAAVNDREDPVKRPRPVESVSLFGVHAPRHLAVTASPSGLALPALLLLPRLGDRFDT